MQSAAEKEKICTTVALSLTEKKSDELSKTIDI
jgi:hypothetical protein